MPLHVHSCVPGSHVFIWVHTPAATLLQRWQSTLSHRPNCRRLHGSCSELGSLIRAFLC